MRWLFSQQAFTKAWVLPCFTVCDHQAKICLRKILSLNFTAMELSYDVLCPFLVWGLRSDDETVIGNRRLHMFESSGTRFIHGLPLFLLARRDEIMKCYFKSWPNGVASRGLCVQRLGTHDQMTRLIFVCQFLASFSFLKNAVLHT